MKGAVGMRVQILTLSGHVGGEREVQTPACPSQTVTTGTLTDIGEESKNLPFQSYFFIDTDCYYYRKHYVMSDLVHREEDGDVRARVGSQGLAYLPIYAHHQCKDHPLSTTSWIFML